MCDCEDLADFYSEDLFECKRCTIEHLAGCIELPYSFGYLQYNKNILCKSCEKHLEKIAKKN